MSERKPIAPGEHSPERLDETLAYFAKSGLLQGNSSERIVRRPRRTPADPYAVAKFVSEKMLRWFQDCMVDEGLVQHPPVAGVTAPMEVIYAMELLWLNVINADNNPATPEQVQKARDAAADYYTRYREADEK